MKILKNKYFILGNIALLLAVIPLTLLFISRQQDIRSRAAPTTKITFEPTTIAFSGEQCGEQSLTVRLDPGENLVSTVDLFLTYDATKFDINIAPNESVFPEILRGPTISNGLASVVMSIGGSVTKVIQVPVDIATITIVPVAATDNSAAIISIDTAKTRAISLSEDDVTTNVFLIGGESAISIDASCISEEPPEPSPTDGESPTEAPTPTGGTGGGTDPTATPTPTGTISPTITQGSNQAPVCTTLSASPSTTGIAPFALTLSAAGSDSDGTISKASFDFGDNITQDVTEGVGTATVATELSHTYQAVGTYSASVIFTDNSGEVSNSCVQQITVTDSGEASPTTVPTSGGEIAPTSTTAPTPTIENPGDLGTTIAVIGGLLLVILGGLALIAL